MLLREPGPLPLSGTCQPWRVVAEKNAKARGKGPKALIAFFLPLRYCSIPPWG